jgi:hypothetical protein
MGQIRDIPDAKALALSLSEHLLFIAHVAPEQNTCQESTEVSKN